MTTATIVVDAADPVFEGHYPGFPVFPGLFLLDRVATLVRPAGARLVGLERAKFTRPVRPGDALAVSAAFDGLRCAVTVSGPGGAVAEFRLRYGGDAS